jgi:transcriptional regulator with XRE-family HTH domain
VLRVRLERITRGWSQTKVSMLTGIAASDISAIERGLRHAHAGWRRRLVQAFKVPEAELFAEVADSDLAAMEQRGR